MKFKETVQVKTKGYRLKPKHFKRWSRPILYLSDVPVSRNWYKTVAKLYQNSYISNIADGAMWPHTERSLMEILVMCYRWNIINYIRQKWISINSNYDIPKIILISDFFPYFTLKVPFMTTQNSMNITNWRLVLYVCL